MAGLELTLPSLRAGLRLWTLSTFGEARQALQGSLLLMGRRDKRTWRGKVSTWAYRLCHSHPVSAARCLRDFEPGYVNVCAAFLC